MSAGRRSLRTLHRVFAVGVCALVYATRGAQAHQRGSTASSCNGCHRGASAPTLTILGGNATVPLGRPTDLTLRIAGGPANRGGFYVTTSDGGTIEPIDTTYTQRLSTGIGHRTPKPGSNGVIDFTIRFHAPDTPGGTVLYVSAVSANGDARTGGDGTAVGALSVAYGCSTPTRLARDFDADGFARDGAVELWSCGPVEGFAAQGGDCDDNDARRNPGAQEVCNQRDEDCDGTPDNDLPLVELHADGDGDGHGRASTETVMGCGPRPGWGLGIGDCRDDDPMIHPEAEELCNYLDDDCDNRVDDGARQYCGEGWCRRVAESCLEGACVPGEPEPETCNYLDDDCDGEVDEGELCAQGESCLEGTCVPTPDDPTGEGTATDAGTSETTADPNPNTGAMGPGDTPSTGGASGSATGTGGATSAREPTENSATAQGASGRCSLTAPGTGQPFRAVLMSAMLLGLRVRHRGSRPTA